MLLPSLRLLLCLFIQSAFFLPLCNYIPAHTYLVYFAVFFCRPFLQRWSVLFTATIQAGRLNQPTLMTLASVSLHLLSLTTNLLWKRSSRRSFLVSLFRLISTLKLNSRRRGVWFIISTIMSNQDNQHDRPSSYTRTSTYCTLHAGPCRSHHLADDRKLKELQGSSVAGTTHVQYARPA
jgi:hypothetical protein